MRTILIPVDFTEHSINTYKYAIKIAGKHKKTQLLFLHSFNDQLLIPDSALNTGFDNDTFMNMQLIEEFKQQADHNMSQIKADVSKYLTSNKLVNFEVKGLVTGGDPGWEITNVCEEINADLIVMGTQGSGKKGILEGSMAKKIMNKAKIPVIAVPADFDTGDVLRIMYAVNNNENDFIKIKFLIKLFEDITFQIFATHFHFDGKDTEEKEHLNKLKDDFSKERAEENICFSLVDTNNKDNSLETFVSHNNINMIAFIAHKSNLFKSLFKNKLTKNDFFKLGLSMIALHE